MKLLRPLPNGRTLDRVRHHYEVEKRLAARLRASTRGERSEILRSMYDELFAEVPDHPRLVRRGDEAATRAANARKWRVLGPLIGPRTVYAEFGPGDCRFALEVAGRAELVYAIDVSDQRSDPAAFPDNFRHITYDGYELGLDDGRVDVAFSDQLLEHIHPDDTAMHLELVRRILRDGGVYVFRTPHAFSGPHDVSRYFSLEPEGFHLKEWTYREMIAALRRAGFRSWETYWQLRGHPVRVPVALVTALETVLGVLPRGPRASLSARLLPRVFMAART